jgi:hypothetical protein
LLRIARIREQALRRVLEKNVLELPFPSEIFEARRNASYRIKQRLYDLALSWSLVIEPQSVEQSMQAWLGADVGAREAVFLAVGLGYHWPFPGLAVNQDSFRLLTQKYGREAANFALGCGHLSANITSDAAPDVETVRIDGKNIMSTFEVAQAGQTEIAFVAGGSPALKLENALALASLAIMQLLKPMDQGHSSGAAGLAVPPVNSEAA